MGYGRRKGGLNPPENDSRRPRPRRTRTAGRRTSCCCWQGRRAWARRRWRTCLRHTQARTWGGGAFGNRRADKSGALGARASRVPSLSPISPDATPLPAHPAPASPRPGFNVVEINASDERSGRGLRGAVEAATQMRSVLSRPGQRERPNCLVLDEIGSSRNFCVF